MCNVCLWSCARYAVKGSCRSCAVALRSCWRAQVSTASAGGCPADLDTISEELFKQLSSGQTVNVAGLLKSAAHSSSTAGGPQTANIPCMKTIRTAWCQIVSRLNHANCFPVDARASRPSTAMPAVDLVDMGRRVMRWVPWKRVQES